MTSVTDKIIAIIAEKALIDASCLNSQSRLDDLGLDSLAMVEMIFSIEEHFDIQVPFDANNPDHSEFDLSSIETIARAVEALVAQRAA